jgi:hypothetical protein
MRLSNKSQGGSSTRLRKQKISVRYFPKKGDILLQQKEGKALCENGRALAFLRAQILL